ncbi:MAG: aldehyde dehydrogenase family protein [Myxococcota bacterium]|nr:aldehyde dehydrogenase family protein [Myxococcota bacterium]
MIGMEEVTNPPGTISPATGETLEPVSHTDVTLIPELIARAHQAQLAWGHMTLSNRAKALHEVVQVILSNHKEVISLMSKETGRSETECLMSEVVGLKDYLNGAVSAAKNALADEPIKLSALDYPGKKAVVEAVPRGVIAIIAPWNFPLSNFWKSLFPALLSGNAVVLKPSEYTPRTGEWLAKQCASVLPEGLVSIVQGDGGVGRALLSANISGVVFTGSVSTGKKVASFAAERLIPCSVELGGKDAAIVLADCDLQRTVSGIVQWGMMNAGQNCAAIERVYVENAIADQFVSKLAAVTSKLRVAPAQGCDIGPLQNATQLAIVKAHVADAVGKGAQILCGGEPTGEGFGFSPTIIDACQSGMKIVDEETFGPVIAVVRVDNADEAVKLANESRYGLNGSVWTKDISKGQRLARKLEVGIALVNNHSLTGIMPQIPWTGTKETGTGVAGSRHSYDTFVRRRTLFTDVSKKPDPWWLPSSPELAEMGAALVQRNQGSLGALLKLAGLVNKRIAAIKKFYS